MGKPGTGAPPDPSVPTFDAGTHTSHFLFNANNYASTAAMKASATSTQEQHGTLNLDTTGGPNGDHCLRTDWDGDGCYPSGTDGDVLLTYEGLGGAAPSVWHLSWQMKLTTNYLIGCGSGDQKLVIVGQDDADNRIVWSASWVGETIPINHPTDPFFSEQTWCIVTAETDPPPGYGFAVYRDATPRGFWDTDNLADGNWHDVVTRITEESAKDTGDGRFEHWVKPTAGSVWRKTMNHLGDVGGNNAFGKVFSGKGGRMSRIQFPTTLNQGTSVPGMSLYQQNMRLYY